MTRLQVMVILSAMGLYLAVFLASMVSETAVQLAMVGWTAANGILAIYEWRRDTRLRMEMQDTGTPHFH